MSVNEARLSGNVDTETSYPDADAAHVIYMLAKLMLIYESQSCPFAVLLL